MKYSVILLFACVLPVSTRAQIVERTMEHDGIEREYRVYIPSSYSSDQDWPLVVNMHGDGFGLGSYIRLTDMNSVAETEGFIAVYPRGVGNSWAAGHDNVAFVERVVAEVQNDYATDDSRVFATGLSSGGTMATTLGLLRPNKFAAVAGVAGGARPFSFVGSPTWPPTIPALPTRPYPLLAISGTADTVVPYNGGDGSASDIRDQVAVEQFIEDWASINGSGLTLSFSRLEDSDPIDGTTVDRYACSDCGTYPGVSGQERDAEVELYRINGGGHNWPDEPDQWPNVPFVQPVSGDISASEVIWDFFSRHELAEGPGPSPLSIVASTHSISDEQGNDGLGDSSNAFDRGVIDGNTRLITKFELPDLHGQEVQNATLKLHLQDLIGDPRSHISILHNASANDLHQSVASYEDSGYTNTGSQIAGDGALAGDIYEIDVTEIILADYATDGVDALSAFRLQLDSDASMGGEGAFTIANNALYAENPTLILTTAQRMSADFDGDGDVDVDDYQVWRTSFGTSGPFPPGVNPDANTDGVVDAADYTVWRDAFAATATPAPEPSAIGIALIGYVVLVNRRY